MRSEAAQLDELAFARGRLGLHQAVCVFNTNSSASEPAAAHLAMEALARHMRLLESVDGVPRTIIEKGAPASANWSEPSYAAQLDRWWPT
jgi:hypothetical protein